MTSSLACNPLKPYLNPKEKCRLQRLQAPASQLIMNDVGTDLTTAGNQTEKKMEAGII